jgi:hypothetical protein
MKKVLITGDTGESCGVRKRDGYAHVVNFTQVKVEYEF